MKNLKVLLSAYACRPGLGSEPSIGWNTACELSKYHQVWLFTRENNREAISAELKAHPIPQLQIVYYDLPKFQWWRKSLLGVHIHHYLWQIGVYFIARQLNQKTNFDLIHHITYVRYSSPSFLSLLPIPFIWGPVGGGESVPKAFWKEFGIKNKAYELLRNIARNFGEIDPFVQITARKCLLARATTEDTAQRLSKLGSTQIEVYSQLGLSTQEIEQLAKHANLERDAIRFISIGRLLHWKGFYLGLQAFAEADLPAEAEYWIIGDGEEKQRLQALAKQLKIDKQVKFWNQLSREETLNKLSSGLALIHPSLHESGGMVCLEAMAAGCPVVCLNLGGPAIQVTTATGFKIEAENPQQVIKDIAKAMNCLFNNPELRQSMSSAGVKRVKEEFAWSIKVKNLAQTYEKLLS